LAQILQMAGRRKEAEGQLNAALQLDPASALARSSLICLYSEWGRRAEVISESSALFFQEGQPETADEIRSIFRKSGFEAAKRFGQKKQLAYLTQLREQRYVSAFSFATIHAQLGDKEEAIQWLQKSYAARDVELPSLPSRSDGAFASIKDDPRVITIIQKVRPPQ
jgi:tetratricopeptide (TPR) repeat protein